tara:strand:+ start:686 stop:1936 length:1251 start_codon:yes stop_codon:yes gene_type:complete
MPLISPNLYNLKQISLYSELTGIEWNLDVVSTVIEFSLYEGMYTESISGNLLIADRNNLMSEIPIVGNEKIYISLEDSFEKTIDLEFKVYSIGSYSIENLGTSGYILNFTSEEYFISENTSISRSYKNLVISEIAKIVYKELNTKKEIEVEDTEFIHDLIIPSWSPFKALKWLTGRAISASHKGASFRFFETFDGYKFKSLESYMQDDVYNTYINIPIPTFKTEVDYQLIRQFIVKDLANVMENQFDGMYSSRVITHDIIKREAKVLDFNYRDTFSDYNHLNPSILLPKVNDNSLDYTDNPQGRIDIVPKHFKLFDNEGQNYNSHREKILQIRKSQFAQINNLRIQIGIDGDLDIRTGNVVDIKTPSGQTDGSWKWDPYLSGKYLVTSIKHTFSPNSHTTLLVLQKDSYSKEIFKE